MDENNNKNDLFDLGSDSTGIDFDPFAEDSVDGAKTDDATMNTVALQKSITETLEQEETVIKTAVSVTESKETDKFQQDNAEKSPVFEYAGATENIDDTSKTFEELRIEKSADFPELGAPRFPISL